MGIANFELFSSSPKDFRVYISDRYPTRDWALIGLFTAADERSIQSFTLERQLFGKFVKVKETENMILDKFFTSYFKRII